MASWKQLGRKTIYDTKFLRLYEDTVQLPDGKVFDDYSIVNTNDGVIIVATDENGNVLMFDEYKYPIDQDILVFPAGGVEPGESPLIAAARELLEETGYESSDIELVGQCYDYPSKVQHLDHIVRIKNAKKTSGITHEATEAIGSLQLIPVSDLNNYWKDGKFKASYMISALAYAFPEQLAN